MTCERVSMPGGGTAIVCGRGPPTDADQVILEDYRRLLATEKNPAIMEGPCVDCFKPGRRRPPRITKTFLCDACWCAKHASVHFLAPTGVRECPGCAHDAGRPFRIQAGDRSYSWPEFDTIMGPKA